MAAPIATILLILASLVAFILLMIFVMVPLFKGIAYLIGWTIGGIGWLFKHVFEFIFGTIGDVIRFVGGVPVFLIFSLLAVLNVVIGRWSAASHFASSAKRECKIGTACLYRAFIRRPLRFVLLDGMLEGFEQRLPEAMAASPGADKPSRRTGQFEGYEIVGSLPGGGSGGKLYVARPDASTMSKHPAMPALVVIKSFALTEGSSLPQIVRESRALECAKQLGHVLEHQMDEHRFYYVMPFHDGDHLGIVMRQLHAEAGPKGLGRGQLIDVMSYIGDLLYTLSAYHRGGLWHKDVKPDNVIVHDGRAHLVDLGLVTPLRSAMTLTTHGTEYFRDPEMVRQALRGVKVHQVDGAKFDIYAVGAVLYFMLENTFPAHGGLSRFSKESPEALRWIVRRSMADYNQRYTAADIMLADLRAVMTARDPFAVKPVDLPSMRGGDAPAPAVADHDAAEPAPQVEAVYAAHTPRPPKDEDDAEDVGVHVYGMAVGPGGVKVGRLGPKPEQTERQTSGGRRPKLRVTNWWTGAYRVDDPATARYDGPEAAAQAQRHDFRDEARAFRREAAHLRDQVAAGTVSARTAARQQLRAARARAKEIQRKAHARGARAGVPSRAPNQPSAFLGFLVVMVIALGALAAITVYKTRAPEAFSLVTIEQSGDPVRRLVVGEERGLPALLVADEADFDDPDVQKRILRFAQKYDNDGYDVIIEPDADHDEIGLWLRQWRKTRSKESDVALEDFMEANNLYAFIHVTGDGERRQLRDLVIHSTRDGARDRRRTIVNLPATAPLRPYLLVNDHPAKVDPAVEQRIGEIVEEHRKHGWSVILDDEVEAEVRRLLPLGPRDPSDPPPALLHQLLAAHQLGGVLFIDSRPGEGEAQDRITVTRIAAEPVSPAVPDAPPNSAG